MSVTELIANEIEKRDLTDQDVARAAGVSADTVRRSKEDAESLTIRKARQILSVFAYDLEAVARLANGKVK